MNKRARRMLWGTVLTVLYLGAQVLLLRVPVPNLSLWTAVFVGLPFLVPIAQSVRIARQSIGDVRRGWWLWAIALALTMVSMLLGGAVRHGDANSIPSTLSFVLDIAGASLSFLVICLPLLAQRSRMALILDFSFAIAFCAIWDGFFLLAPIMNSPRHLLKATLVVRAVIFLFALLMAKVALSDSLARLIRVIAVFTWFRFMAYFFLGQIVWGWMNRPTDSTWDWVREVAPIGVAFAIASSRVQPVQDRKAHPRISHLRFPLLFAAILCGIAFWIALLNLRFGVFAAVIALLFVGIRAVFLPALQYLAKIPAFRSVLPQPIPADEDRVTGLVSSRVFTHTLEDLWAAMAEGTSLSVLCCDLDFYAETRHDFGTPYAESCLTTVAAVLEQAGIDRPEYLARIDQSRFAILLPYTGLSQALDLAESICREIRSIALFSTQGRVLTVSVGVGTARVSPEHGPGSLLSEAEHALQDARRLGRNRVEFRLLAKPAKLSNRDYSEHLHSIG